MLKTINSTMFRKIIIASAKILDDNKNFVDSLNVFPVPDGDTGTNMSMTYNNVVKELNNCLDNDFASVTRAIITGALRGARGNSGVILSQILKGICNVIGTCEKEITTKFFAKALAEGSAIAYKAVASPKEGSEYTYTSNLLIEFGYYFYYGVVENNWELLGDNVKKLGNLKLSTRKNIEFDNITLNQQGLVFSYPTIYGTLEHIYDRHGLDYIDDYTKYEVLVDGVNYFVYFNKNSLIISNYSQTFSFGIENNSVGDDNKDINQHSGLIDAWVDKNSPGGLVQIEGTGKIPSHLLPNYEIESEYSFIKINKFVTTFPSKNLTVGDRWYSTIDKKIFTATSTTQGVISDPQENTIYINTSENTFYIWASDIEDMVLFGGLNSTKIIDVTEIL